MNQSNSKFHHFETLQQNTFSKFLIWTIETGDDASPQV